ncbi:DUF1330 domain-containing protein [Litoribacillus peritrichatus]|uniref:DUF1330 domain-containing protein n=1 Tax=Litoribacillus peritrichatus TaxID=718191 RepID=A0ABP7M9I5_9GAMM
MSAYVIVGFTPKDKEKLQEYSASVPPTLAKFSGEMLAKGPIEHLHGDADHAMKVIVTFPSKDEAIAWYNSEEYQALIPTRDQGMDAKFQLIG